MGELQVCELEVSLVEAVVARLNGAVNGVGRLGSGLRSVCSGLGSDGPRCGVVVGEGVFEVCEHDGSLVNGVGRGGAAMAGAATGDGGRPLGGHARLRPAVRTLRSLLAANAVFGGSCKRMVVWAAWAAWAAWAGAYSSVPLAPALTVSFSITGVVRGASGCLARRSPPSGPANDTCRVRHASPRPGLPLDGS